jgi:hypothetical protein
MGTKKWRFFKKELRNGDLKIGTEKWELKNGDWEICLLIRD